MKVVSLFSFFLLGCFLTGAVSVSERLSRAYSLHQEALKEARVAQQCSKWSAAISEYRSLLEQGEEPTLYYNLGNCCSALEEWPWALYYYRAGQRLSPHDPQFSKAIQEVRGQLNLGEISPPPLLGERTQAALLAALSFVWLIVGSMAVWRRSKGMRRTALFFGTFVFLVYGGVGIWRIAGPTEAVVIHSSMLENKGVTQIVPKGSLVRVWGCQRSQEEVRVWTEDGQSGVLPLKVLRTL